MSKFDRENPKIRHIFGLRYIDFILSRIISYFTKCEVRIGGVGFVRLEDVTIRIAWLSIHIDVISLKRDSAHPTRFGILVLEDVRIEAEKNEVTSSGTSSGTSSRKIWLQRFTRFAQYCGLVINRVHIVVMNTIPECLLHVTIDELSLETFRSREGWQFETSCSLIQGKLLRRNSRSERSLLAEVSMPFQLSLDIDKDYVDNVALRISTPSFAFTDDFLGIVESCLSREKEKAPSEDVVVKEDSFLSKLLSLNIDIRSISLKYTVTSGTESRYITTNIKQIQATRTSFQILELIIADQLLRSEIRLNWIQYEQLDTDQERIRRSAIDGISAKVSMHDLHWWKGSVEKQKGILETFRFRRSGGSEASFKTEKPPEKKSIAIEISDLTTEILDFDYQRSQMKLGFLSFEKSSEPLPGDMEHQESYELSLELLFFGSIFPDSPDLPQFEMHRWGESVFIGALIIEWKVTDSLTGSLIDVTCGCDDFKFEWSDRLARQIEGILIFGGSGADPNITKNEPEKILAIQVSMNRVAVLVDVSSKTSNKAYAALTASKLEFLTEDVRKERILKIEMIRGATGIRNTKEYLYLADIFESERIKPKEEEEEKPTTSPTRRWSQLEREKNYREERAQRERGSEYKQFISMDSLEILVDREAPVIDKISIFTPNEVYLAWSPQLHLIAFHAWKSVRKTFQHLPKPSTRKVPRKKHLILTATDFVEVQIELARNHRMFWQGEKFNFERFDSQMRMSTEMLYILMNEQRIISVLNPCILVQTHDEMMSQSRAAFATLQAETNRIWNWTADKFLFRLPFDFNFAEIFTEFSNIIKWIKVVHEVKKSEFTEQSPLPSDVRIEFQEVCLELEDDEFENRLKLAAQLKEDEVYEREKRDEAMDEQLANLKKMGTFLSKETLEKIRRRLFEKNSDIYIHRWNVTEISDAPLFLSKWKGWSMRAFADLSLHGTEKCIQMMKSFDPLSPIPEQKYSTLWARAVEFDVDEWTVTFKDYPMKYLDIKDLHFFGTLVAAESIADDGRCLRECTIPLPDPFPTHTVQRNMSPLKFYYDLQCGKENF
ncbi:hypothetical protein B9Z55_003816 [Caenorhabditis nigoni]|uniref:FMP27/BLTP2/Hobbit GFWDK motif-containing RBG unit domain-containing protein n=1 Tax=Caenorhabditis nigoni TaxID=1611254 RepID=A0A2G5VSI1_9PELO|nr:hypothetical protein B9Z55_003816 [Caenorhabditis nigoni]